MRNTRIFSKIIVGIVILGLAITGITTYTFANKTIHNSSTKMYIATKVKESTKTPSKIESISVNDYSKLTLEEVIASGAVVVIGLDKKSSITGIKEEAYHVDKLDQFLKNYTEGVPANLLVFEYEKDGKDIWVNKLSYLEFDGKQLQITPYDTYSTPGKFEPIEKPTVIKELNKTVDTTSTRYGITVENQKNTDGSMYLVSFFNKAIVR